MNIVLFEDALVSQLEPITLSRPAYTISCGGYRLLELAQEVLCRRVPGQLHASVRPHLEGIQSDYVAPQELDPQQRTLLVNARLAPDARVLEALAELTTSGTDFQVRCDDSLAAALLPAGTLQNQTQLEHHALAKVLAQASTELPEVELVASNVNDAPTQCSLFEYPHTIVSENSRLLTANLLHRITGENLIEIAEGVFSPVQRKLPAHVVFHSAEAKGPIVLGTGVELGAFSVLDGPLYLGTDTRVSPHTLLKGNVSIGNNCKVGGEVSQSVIEPFSNKVHFGYLGNAYVGSWVNLGAGTTNSNLKNTYGTVRMEYTCGKVDTGLQFMGCVIGDFSKAAINTSIFTGKTIGVCSNVYGFVTQNVPSFANYARSLGDVTEHPPEVMEVTQRRCFERRGREQRDCDRQLIRDMYAIEQPRRQLVNKPPSL